MDKEKTKRIVAPNGVKIIINREFIGMQSIEDALIPIIYEDIKKQIDNAHTFDLSERAS